MTARSPAKAAATRHRESPTHNAADMDHLLPILETRFQNLVVAFRFVVFAMLVIGLIIHMSRHHYHSTDLVRPVARAITITALVASMGWWFPLAENTLLAVATYIDSEYANKPTRAADLIRESATPNPEGKEWSWRKLNESIYHAITDGLTWFFVKAGSFLIAPMTILQYILRWILYLLTPFALGCFMIPALNGMAVRFFQQVLAVFSWPVGFAITNLLAITIWQDFRAVVGANPEAAEMILYAPFLDHAGAILATLTLIIGTISTPVVCQMLFAQGYAFTGAHSTPTAMGRAVQQSGMFSSSRGGSSGGGKRPALHNPADSGANAAKPAPPPQYANPFVHPPGL